MGLVEKVGPQFEFAEDQEVGRDAIEHAPHRPAEVEWAGEHGRGSKPPARQFEPCGRRTRHRHVERKAVGLGPRLDRPGKGSEQLDLADTHSVEPDALPRSLVSKRGPMPEKSDPGVGDGAPSGEAPPSDPREQRHEEGKVEEVEEHALHQWNRIAGAPDPRPRDDPRPRPRARSHPSLSARSNS